LSAAAAAADVPVPSSVSIHAVATVSHHDSRMCSYFSTIHLEDSRVKDLLMTLEQWRMLLHTPAV
ncbi:hypothetical protein PV327_005696, partial [Microctonus hyperodae]